MDFTLKIEITASPELLDVLRALTGETPAPVRVEVDETPAPVRVEVDETPAPVRVKPDETLGVRRGRKPKEETPAPVEETPAEPVEETPAEPVEVSFADLRAKATEFAQASPANWNKVKEVLTAMGAKKVTDLKPAQYSEFLNNLK